jgi:hypothetical protein
MFTYDSGNRQYLDWCMCLLSINTFTVYPQVEKHAQNLKLLENYNYNVSSGQVCEIPMFWRPF